MSKYATRTGFMRHGVRAAATLCCVAAVSAGCRQASPNAPDPPSGGQVYVLSYDVFASQVAPILTERGCDHQNCHGGGIRGTYELSPAGDKDTAFDFAQSVLQVEPTNPPASPLVMKPLAEECGGPGHGGGASFLSFDDPAYLAILDWIEAGEFR